MDDVKVTINRAGVRELFKSQEMCGALESVAANIAEQCNERAYRVIESRMGIKPSDVRKTPYEGGVKKLRNTAIGYVDAKGLGLIVERIDHAASARNH